MSEPKYLHGYDDREQNRLIAQAAHWRDFILEDIELSAGARFLEIGCGAGAVLHVVGTAHPRAFLAGIDIESRQIDRARGHLASLPTQVDLRVGDASKLPWPDESFDRVFFMWMLEHLHDQDPVLRDARRVLKPGGKVIITETDYNFVTYPENDDFVELMRGWRTHFASGGDVTFARRVGPALLRCGFRDVRVRLGAYHNFRGEPNDALARTANYHADYIEPEIEKIVQEEYFDREKLLRGVHWLRSLAKQPDASITGTVYRATGVR